VSLADHWDGDWLRSGWHEVQVVDLDTSVRNDKTGNSGVSFDVQDERGAKGKVTFWLTDKALWRLASFAAACGLTREEGAKYEPTERRSHLVLMKRKLQVLVIPDGKYHRVDDWMPLGQVPPSAPPAAPEPERETTPTDEIPF
jgi:hypothetical protein